MATFEKQFSCWTVHRLGEVEGYPSNELFFKASLKLTETLYTHFPPYLLHHGPLNNPSDRLVHSTVHDLVKDRHHVCLEQRNLVGNGW